MGFMNSEWYDAAASGYLLEVRESQSKKPKSWRCRFAITMRNWALESVLFYPQQLPACSVPVASADLRKGL